MKWGIKAMEEGREMDYSFERGNEGHANTHSGLAMAESVDMSKRRVCENGQRRQLGLTRSFR